MKKIKMNFLNEEREFEVRKGFYDFPHNLALALYDNDELFGVVTVNFPDEDLVEDVAYLDTNNFPDIENAFFECGLYTYRNKQSGFCSYPAWYFTADFLEECGDMA